MLDYQRMFHTGFLVRDLREAMDLYQRTMGVRWATPYVYEALALWSPERGEHQVRLEVAYSRDGPQHLEIQAGEPGSVYDADVHSGHHVGFWVDDVAAAAEPMLAKGWTIVVANKSPEQGFGTFVYLRPPTHGMLVELVNVAALPRFENWWNGAPGPIL